MERGVCHVCRYTGERICDPQEAQIRCLICGRCEAEEPNKKGDNK